MSERVRRVDMFDLLTGVGDDLPTELLHIDSYFSD